MVAPIDAKTTFEVEGEEITLRLNFRALSLAKKNGVNLMAAKSMDPLDIAVAIRCLASQDHPKMDDEEAFAIVAKAGEQAGSALSELFADFGGSSAEGNAPKKVKAKT